MKRLALVLLALATALAITQKASADPITGTLYVYGTDSFTATSLTVNPVAAIGTSTIIGEQSPTGDFAPLAGDSVTLENLSTAAIGDTMLSGPDGLAFILDSYSIVSASNTFWNIVGTGTFDLNGYAPTLYSFSFTTTGGKTASFNAAATTPEPSTLLLLGTGFLGLALIIFRRAKSSPRMVLNM